jgi:hypothetical protein
MATASGRITLVQEGRFRLVTDDGRGLLLRPTPRANVGVEDLCRLHESGARVRVEYRGEPNLASGVVERVTEE